MVAFSIVTACSQVEVVGCIVKNYIKGDNCTASNFLGSCTKQHAKNDHGSSKAFSYC